MRRWLGLLAVFLCGAVPAQDLSLRTVQQAGSTVKYDPDGPPQKPGLCMEILRAVVKAEPGLHFTGLDQHTPLKRVERLLAEGQIDAFFCLLKSPERERQWRYAPVPLYVIRHVVVQRANDRRHFDTLAELAEASHTKRVLVMRGTAIARHLLNADVSIAEVGSEREALQMLSLGRADLIYGFDGHSDNDDADTQLSIINASGMMKLDLDGVAQGLNLNRAQPRGGFDFTTLNIRSDDPALPDHFTDVSLGVGLGIGNTFFEKVVYDEAGQILTGTFMDYLVATSVDVPRVELDYIATPSPLNPLGMKGAGQGGQDLDAGVGDGRIDDEQQQRADRHRDREGDDAEHVAAPFRHRLQRVQVLDPVRQPLAIELLIAQAFHVLHQ